MAINNFPTPMVFAHRGACAHAPENTLVSFETALQHGAPAIEFDVKLTSDGEVVVIHDQTLDRTTDGRGDVRKFTLVELKKLDAGGKFDPSFKGEQIPTLREVFESYGSKLLMNVELTNYATPGDNLVDEVAKLVKKYQMEDRVLFSSFLPRNLIQARKLCPEVPNGLLTLEGIQGRFLRIPGIFWIPREALHPYFADVTPQLISREHDYGRRVHTWTVNKEDDLRRIYSMGVDAVFTDDPRLALQVIASLP